MKRLLLGLGITSTLLMGIPTLAFAQDYTNPNPTALPFDDVNPYSPTYKAITCLRSLGVVHGYVDNVNLKNFYLPDRALTRDEALKLVIRSGAISIDRKDRVTYDPAFGENMSDIVQFASGSDIINPVLEEQAFRPKDNVTRFEFLKMAIKANGVEVSRTIREKDKLKLYIDVDPMSDFVPYVLRSKESNLMEPNLMTWDALGQIRSLNWMTSDRLRDLTGEQVVEVFNGDTHITREIGAEFLYRLLNVKRDGFSPPYNPSSDRNICSKIFSKTPRL